MNSLEKKSIETFVRLFDAVGKPNAESLHEASSLIHPNFRGYGTSLVEQYTSKENLEWFLNEQARQMPGGFAYEIHQMHFKHVNESVAEIFANMSFEVHTPRGTIPMELMRVTAVLVKDGENMLITQFHCSVPDRSAAQDEIVPGSTEPKIYEEVSILFTDFSGFTTMTSTLPPKKLLLELNDIFASFDHIMLENNMTKIKTIGDSYMAASGLADNSDHAINAIKSAKEMIAYLEKRNLKSPIKWDMRVGIHSGSVIGGILGKRILSFDLYGDTVNLASAVEQAGEINKINISAYTYALVQDIIPCEYRGRIEIKDKRMIDMYFVN